MALSRGGAWFTALLALACALLLGGALPVAAPLEDRAATFLAPAVGAVRGVTRPITDVVLNAGQLRALAEENATLRQDLARLEGDLATLRERSLAAEQVAALEAAAGAEAGPHVSASVLLHDPVAGRDLVLVDRGARDGLLEGQPALGPGATLVGVVAEVHERTARIRLLTDRDSAVAVLLQRSRTPASLVADEDGLRLDFVPLDTPSLEGDLVLTAALGGALPPGLPVGRVASTSARPQDLFLEVALEPLTDYARLEHVLVLTAFRPAEPPAEPPR